MQNIGRRRFLQLAGASALAAGELHAGAHTARGASPVTIGPGGQLIVGGFDPERATDAPARVRELRAAIPRLQSLGVTSHECYVRWNLCEVAPGRFDWSVYDAYMEVYRASGLKWVPFLICGSAYSLPDWYYKRPGYQGYVCLEHGLECDVQSHWNPALRGHVERFIRAFCSHYGETGVIESILLGITGNYGEAIYPVTGNEWTANIHGPYHTHLGYWAGDPHAVESFRMHLRRKYRDTGALRRAWGAQAPDLAAIKPFLRNEAPGDRAWLDFMEWYIGSMTEWARFWLRTTRAAFPHGDIYLCTGGDATPQHGSDFGQQCKEAAAIHGGVRITNESSDYAWNFALTRWVASAGRQYGAYFSFEPAGSVDANGVVVRIYNATASGARGLHYYYGNLFDTPQATANFERWGAWFQQRAPVTEIALYYPETQIRLRGNDFLHRARKLRDRFDFQYMSDGQIMDGGLRRVRALIIMAGSVAEDAVWRRVSAWVRGGGLLLLPAEMAPPKTVEGAPAPFAATQFEAGSGAVSVGPGAGDSDAYCGFLATRLREFDAFSVPTRAMLAADGAADGVYATAGDPHNLLWLNTTDASAARRHASVPARGMALEVL